MDTVSVYQTVYTVLFVLAGVFFAAAVAIFFLFGIPTVISNLTGGSMRRERKAPAKRARPARKTPAAGRRPAAAAETRTQVQTAGGGTVVMEEPAGTVVMSGEETTAPVEDGITGETTAPLSGAGARTAAEAAREAMEKLGFRPGETVLVCGSEERV